MRARNATVKKVDKTLRALSSVTLSVTPNTDHVKHGAVSPAIASEDSEDSDGWETDLECEEVNNLTQNMLLTRIISTKGNHGRVSIVLPSIGTLISTSTRDWQLINSWSIGGRVWANFYTSIIN